MSGRRARERWMKRMEAAGRRAAGRQCTLAVHSQCGRHVLSPPQRATAAKQAKCRQTFGSTWVPHIRSPGVAVGAGWLGTRGRTGASLPFCGCSGVEAPEPAAPGVSTAGSRGEGWLWFLDVGASASDPREPAQPRPGTLSWRSVRKAKAKGRGVPITTGATGPVVSQGLPPPLRAWRAALAASRWLWRGIGLQGRGTRDASRSCPHLRPQLAKGGEQKPPGICRGTFI